MSISAVRSGLWQNACKRPMLRIIPMKAKEAAPPASPANFGLQARLFRAGATRKPVNLALVPAVHPTGIWIVAPYGTQRAQKAELPQHLARSLGAPKDDHQRERRWRAMRAADPQSWRGEGREPRRGSPAHNHSIGLFNSLGLPTSQVDCCTSPHTLRRDLRTENHRASRQSP